MHLPKDHISVMGVNLQPSTSEAVKGKYFLSMRSSSSSSGGGFAGGGGRSLCRREKISILLCLFSRI